jgi:hypothetical protein
MLIGSEGSLGFGPHGIQLLDAKNSAVDELLRQASIRPRPVFGSEDVNKQGA